MFTVEGARRRGISRVVLAHLEDRAAALGYRRLVLETGTAQPEALALYEASGWVRITAYGHYRDSPESICFAKELGPPA
jgi:GNAT superfamily N-acetyltransferase